MRSSPGSATRLYYASDCAFCRWTLAWVLRWDRRRRVVPVPIESAEGDRDLGDLGAARLDSWHIVRDGKRHSAGSAFAPLLEELPGGRALAPLARRLEWLLVPAYGWVARHRTGLSKLVPEASKRRADEVVARRTYSRM